MTRLTCPPNEWTTVPASGETLIEAKANGLYIDTTGALTVEQAADGYTLDGNTAMVINAANAASVRAIPANKVHPVDLTYQPV